MKAIEQTETGKINNRGQLEMYMGELNEFFAKHKGSRVIARFIVAKPGTSEALKGYYYNAVVPKFRQGMYDAGERLTEKQTEHRMRQISPIMQDERVNTENGRYTTRIKEINEISNAELIEYIDYIKQYAAENLNVYIEDPRVI